MTIMYKDKIASFAYPPNPDLEKKYDKFVTVGKPFSVVQYALLKKMINEDTDCFVVPQQNNCSGYNLRFQFDRVNYGKPNVCSSAESIVFNFKKIIFEP